MRGLIIRCHLLGAILVWIGSGAMPGLCSEAPPLPAEEIYRQMAPMVVSIHVVKNNGQSVTGTGFVHEKNGFGVTAWHVLENAARAEAKFISGITIPIAGILDHDAQRDIALFPLDIKVTDLPVFMKGIPKIGSRVYAIGSPKGLEFSISDGILSQVREFSGIRQYQISCPISPGNSGGPILNDAGKVIGVSSWQVNQGQNLNFACPIEYVAELGENKPVVKWSEGPKVRLRNLSRQPALHYADQLALLRVQLPPVIEKLETGDIAGYLKDFINPPERLKKLADTPLDEWVAKMKPAAPKIAKILKSLIGKDPIAVTDDGLYIFDVPNGPGRPGSQFKLYYDRSLKRFFGTFR